MSEELIEQPLDLAPNPVEVLKQKQRDNLAKARATAKANREAKKAAAEAPKPEGVVAKSVQVRGALMEIKDGSGRVWTVPADDEEDYQLHRSIFKVDDLKGFDPQFDYQFEMPVDLGPMLTNDWAIVSRKELGLPELAGMVAGAGEYGAALTGAHMAGGMVCLKKPKVLVDRTRKAFKNFADAIVGQMSPPQNSAKQKLEGQNAIEVAENKSSTTFREPKPV